MVNTSDEMLIEIIVDRVIDISDEKHVPKKDDVVEFLKALKPAKKPEKPPLPPPPNGPPPPSGRKVTVTHRYKINDQIHNGRNGKDVYMKVLDYVLTEYDRFEELKNQNFNKMKSRSLGAGYHLSENGNEIPKRSEHKTKLMKSANMGQYQLVRGYYVSNTRQSRRVLRSG